MRREVVSAVVEMIFDCMEERDHDAEAYCVRAGLPGGREELARLDYVSWEYFTNLLELLRLEFPDEPWEELVSRRFVELPIARAMRRQMESPSP